MRWKAPCSPKLEVGVVLLGGPQIFPQKNFLVWHKVQFLKKNLYLCNMELTPKLIEDILKDISHPPKKEMRFTLRFTTKAQIESFDKALKEYNDTLELNKK